MLPQFSGKLGLVFWGFQTSWVGVTFSTCPHHPPSPAPTTRPHLPPPPALTCPTTRPHLPPPPALTCPNHPTSPAPTIYPHRPPPFTVTGPHHPPSLASTTHPHQPPPSTLTHSLVPTITAALAASMTPTYLQHTSHDLPTTHSPYLQHTSHDLPTTHSLYLQHTFHDLPTTHSPYLLHEWLPRLLDASLATCRAPSHDLPQPIAHPVMIPSNLPCTPSISFISPPTSGSLVKVADLAACHFIEPVYEPCSLHPGPP